MIARYSSAVVGLGRFLPVSVQLVVLVYEVVVFPTWVLYHSNRKVEARNALCRLRRMTSHAHLLEAGAKGGKWGRQYDQADQLLPRAQQAQPSAGTWGLVSSGS